MTLTIRSMTEREFEAMRAATITEYAQDNVAAGRWTAEVALAQSAAQLDQLLPGGHTSEGHVFLVACDSAGTPVGHVWVSVHDPTGERPGAWIYDIGVVDAHRGRGYSRALLAAAERAAADAGADSIGLNVFGHNPVARRLYETAGYQVVTQQMRKPLGAG